MTGLPYYIRENLYICAVMDFVRQFRILKYLVICLACFSVADKADDLLSHQEENPVTVSRVTPVENYTDSGDFHSFTTPEAQCRIPRQTSISNTFRTFAQAKRLNHLNSARHGFIMEKPGKSMNQYTTSLFSVSILNFPSGLSETTHRLISLGKLII